MRGSGDAANRAHDDIHNERNVERDQNVNGGVGSKEVEAQITKNDHVECMGLRKLFGEKEIGETSNLSESCAFPPGFGPCFDEAHVHSDMHLDTASVLANPRVEAHIDDEDRAEALKTKELCKVGGIHFKIRNDEDLLVRLAGKKLQCKIRADGADNKPKQGRNNSVEVFMGSTEVESNVAYAGGTGWTIVFIEYVAVEESEEVLLRCLF
ncbi:hypothetical protein PIB30_048217 [Stylosanthes scabra]|uniref:Uncharacterized protein n=1 Tax=Stylosanthes scabra TaxID=79078 RepID=A0ABU6THB2_9FABA|nr:hypothetical protein [Stylosanthes scabra]